MGRRLHHQSSFQQDRSNTVAHVSCVMGHAASVQAQSAAGEAHPAEQELLLMLGSPARRWCPAAAATAQQLAELTIASLIQ